MGWVVAHKTLLSSPVPIGIGIWAGLGLDNYDFYRVDGVQLVEAQGSPAGVVCAPHNVAAEANEAKLC